MRQLLSSVLCLVMVGCGQGVSHTPFTPYVEPEPVRGSFRLPQVIHVGDRIEVEAPKGGRASYHFNLTAPADGTLEVRLAWDAPGDEVLQMSVGGTIFGMVQLPESGIPDLGPYSTVDGRRSLVGSVSARSGGDYRIWVASVPGYWDDGGYLGSSFTLTTSMQ